MQTICTRESKAFTLIDVLLGIALVMVGLVALSYLTTIPTVLNRDARYNMLAYRAARDQIESLRQQYRSSLPANCTNTPFTSDSVNQLPSGSARMTIADYPSVSNLKSVLITITWADTAQPGRRSISVSTLLGRMVQ
ncbi:MAG: type IV pilus modification PilV family protein [Armatimonadota bacterium]